MKRKQSLERNRILAVKDNIIRKELNYFVAQVSASVSKIDECFEIIFPGVPLMASAANTSSIVESVRDSDTEDQDFDNIEWEESSISNIESSSAAGVPYTLVHIYDTELRSLWTSLTSF